MLVIPEQQERHELGDVELKVIPQLPVEVGEVGVQPALF